MHELYIAQSIISSVKKSLPNNVTADQVTHVRVEAGQLDAVVDETLIFLFDAIKAESGLSAATLTVEIIPVRCRCKACAHEFTLDLPIFLCPQCGSGDVDLLQGRGIRLTGIKADVEED
ncbi:hydrogenase maturation nickel metallochaperone HypA [candidate division KSB1 bacterium]|nr:MAG: hydrogenase maturation nickel metallochaperone HypA [candidate division KSB1 bacterium]